MTAPEEVIALDVFGDYAHFRKPFTTSSPLTYGVPPRTAVTGLLGAIMGLPRKSSDSMESYHSVFSPQKTRIAVVPSNPVKKQTMGLNLLRIKGETEKIINLKGPPSRIERSQVPFEFVRNPRYRIYLSFENQEYMEKLVTLLKHHKSIYTPYFGISELIAEFKYKGLHEAVPQKGEVDIHSVVDLGKTAPVFEKGRKYIREHISTSMDEDRTVQSFTHVLYEENGAEGLGIKVKITPYFTVEDTGHNILFVG